MNFAQRVVVVIGLAGVLNVAGDYIVTAGGSCPSGGWFGYAPGTGRAFGPSCGLAPAVRLVIWAVIIIVWVVLAVCLLGTSTGEAATEDQRDA